MLKPIGFRDLVAATATILAVLALPPVSYSQANLHSPQEARNRLRNFPLTKFYDTADLKRGKPGDLIRSEQFDEYDLPEGVLATRILYHSRSATRQDVPVSGVVLYPERIAPAGGWPVIAWAHAADGVARQCAPSLARNLQHGPFLSMYVKLGYAVVASDYAGLGTISRNAFSDSQSNATDIIYSVPAARIAVQVLSSHWIAVGIEEGANAVVAVAELEHGLQDANYLGSVAISALDDPAARYPASQPTALYDRPLSLAYGIKTVFPNFDPKEILTDKAVATYAQVEQSCGESAGARLSPTEMLKANWASNTFVRQYFGRNTLGQSLAQAPILVIAGELNLSIPIQITDAVVARMCKQGSRVQLEKYPQSDAATVFGDSVRNQISWIQARFGGKQAEKYCRE